MPMHDWSHVDDAIFHSFQLGWTSELSARLNGGILPSSHFAITETIELRPPVGFQLMPEPDHPFVIPRLPGMIRDTIPNTQYASSDLRRQYACVGITIRHAEHHQPVAAILWITRQDKQTPYRFRAFVQTAIGAITHGIHLLIIDMFPPSKRDPQGIHKAIWDEIEGDEPFELPTEQPLTLAAYVAGNITVGRSIRAYVETVGVGNVLPDMPAYLDADCHVPVPLESTYQATWASCPADMRYLVEHGKLPDE